MSRADFYPYRLMTQGIIFMCGAAAAALLTGPDLPWPQRPFDLFAIRAALDTALTNDHHPGEDILLGFISLGIAAVICVSLVRHHQMRLRHQCFPKAHISSTALSDNTKFDGLSRELDHQIAEIASFVNIYLEASLGQSRAVAQAQCTISDADTLDQVRVAVETLVRINTQTLRDAEELRDNLREAKLQAETLRSKLASAEKLAVTDGLTLVANRRRFDEFLEVAVRDSHNAKAPLTLVLADLDHFKRINDRFGHPIGDAVLRAFASLLSTNVRSKDLIARLGGEEFGIVLPDTPVGNASALVERIQHHMRNAFNHINGISQEIDPITASFGITEVVDNDTSEDVIRRADDALYKAKHSGRNRFEIIHTQKNERGV